VCAISSLRVPCLLWPLHQDQRPIRNCYSTPGDGFATGVRCGRPVACSIARSALKRSYLDFLVSLPWVAFRSSSELHASNSRKARYPSMSPMPSTTEDPVYSIQRGALKDLRIFPCFVWSQRRMLWASSRIMRPKRVLHLLAASPELGHACS
jgi:hypothetical protein